MLHIIPTPLIINQTLPQIQNIQRNTKTLEKIEQQKKSIEYSKNILFKDKETNNTYNTNVINDWSILLNWDEKTDIFKISLFIDSKNLWGHLPPNCSITINNEQTLYFDLKKDTNEFISTSFNKKISFSNLKTISIDLKFEKSPFFRNSSFYSFIKTIQKTFSIVIPQQQDNSYKKDIQLLNDENNFNLKIQTGIYFKQNKQPEKLYENFDIKLLPWKQGHHNQELLEVKYNKDKPFGRINVKVKSIENLPISKNKTEKFDFLDVNNNKIIFNKNTLYDINKKETILGFGKNSYPGYVIPYDYSGTFFPILTFDLNEYKNIKLSWPQKISKQFFDKKNSIINLKIRDVNEDIDHLINEIKWLNIKHNFFDLIENKDITYEKLIEKLDNKLKE